MSSLFGIGANGASSFYNGATEQSARFPATSGTSSSNARLTKTFGTVDSNVHWTLNFWVKRSATEGYNPVGGARPLEVLCPRSGTSASVLHEFHFGAPGSYGTGDAFVITNTNSGTYILSTINLFQDTTAWYNIHVQADLDNSTNGEKLKIFVNGVEAAYTTDNRGSYTSMAGIAAGAWTIGDYYNYGYPLNGYLANWAYVDGSTLAPTVFGEFKEGTWIPKKITGVTWGSAGHLLAFQDSSALGDDTSGNGNDWTVSNMTTHDQMPDNPENNFATGIGTGLSEPTNPQNYSQSTNWQEGNLKLIPSTSAWSNGNSNFGFRAGKWYAEFRLGAKHGTEYVRFGMCANPARTYDEYMWVDNGNGQIDGTTSPYSDRVGTYTGGDILQIAVDMDSGTRAIWFGKNGTWENSATISEIAAGTTTNAFVASNALIPINDGHCYFLYAICHSAGTYGWWNFGQDSTFAGETSAGGNTDANGYGNFKYPVPSGFLAQCTANLPEPDIGPNSLTQPDDHFNTILYTGNGSDGRSITGVGFKPDLNWVKNRSHSGFDHILTDTTRGGDKQLMTTGNYAEGTATNKVETIDADGFTVGQSVHGSVNANSNTYVAWNWKANGGSTTTNDASSTGVGTIDSVYQANTTAGFSIVSYTGTGSEGTIAHGLSAAPELVIIKNRTDARNWVVGHKRTSATYAGQLYMNTNGAWSSNDGSFGTVAPTSTVVNVNSDQTTNESGDSMIMYCFHPVEGYSHFGNYTGNGSTDGPYCYTGFRPAYVMVKEFGDTGEDWMIWDNKRSPYNPVVIYLGANQTWADDGAVGNTHRRIEMFSNGFKTSASHVSTNENTTNYIYMAFAEMPFKYANARA